MYTTDYIFLVLEIKQLANQDRKPTTPHKLETITKPPVSNLHVLFFPCAVQKANAHVDTKALNMRHESQKSFWSIFFEIPQHQNGYLIYVHITRKIFSSHDVLFEKVSSVFRGNCNKTTSLVYSVCYIIS